MGCAQSAPGIDNAGTAVRKSGSGSAVVATFRTHMFPMANFLFLGNDEIEIKLQRDRLTAKDEIKVLLLDSGKSGKVRYSYRCIVSQMLSIFHSRRS
jgi:hypothetical protein